MRKIFGLPAIIMIFSVSAFADIRLPDTPKPKPAQKVTAEMTGKMHINVRSDAKVATLKIRRETLKKLRAAIDEADDAQNVNASIGETLNITPIQTIASGMFLSLAFVFGGVWMFRSKGKTPKIAMSLLALAVLSAGAGIVLANTAPPQLVGLTSRIFDKNTKTYGYANGSVQIQIIDRQPGVYTGLDSTDVILEIPSAEEDKNSE